MLFDLYNDALSRISRVPPTKLSLILTHKCNSRCVMCNIWQERKPGELSPSEYQQLSSDPFFSRVRKVFLSGGEASLRQDFLDICSALVDGLPQLNKISLATNGIATEIVLARVKGMLELAQGKKIAIAVQVSVDGVGEEHDQIRGVRAANSKVRRTVTELTSLRTHNPSFSISANCVIQPENLAVIDQVNDYFQQAGVDPFFAVVTTSDSYYGNMTNDRLAFDERQLPQLHAVLQRLWKSTHNPGKRLMYADLLGILKGRPQMRSCPMLREVFFLEHDGKVIPCINAEDYVMGDIRAERPSQIWQSAGKQILPDIKQKLCPDCLSTCGVSLWNAGLYSIRQLARKQV